MEFNSVPFISFITSVQVFFSKLSSLCSHPLFSTVVTIYTLILLYVPSLFQRILLSPVLNSTAIILLSLLKLGANERSGKELCFQESIILDSSTNKRLEKEFDHLEPQVLDCKDRPHEINGANLGVFSSFDQESSSLEPRVLDLVHEGQTNIEFKTEMHLDLECNQTHVESNHKSCLGLGSTQMHVEFENDLGLESSSQDDYHKWELIESNSIESSQVVEKGDTRMEMDLKQLDTTLKFLEWNMKAPLEIIYEAYEGEGEEEEEEEDEDDESNKNNMVSSDKHFTRCERHPSLSMYFPESETDSSSDDDFPMNENWETHEHVFLKWEEEEEDREELIEIPLDRYGKKCFEFCHVEEDNLIEIEIFPTIN